MAITGIDSIAQGLGGGQWEFFTKTSMTAKAAGDFQSLWTQAGNPTAGAAPGTAAGVAPTSATVGALSYANPSGSNIGYLGFASTLLGTVGTLVIADRLVHTSTLVGNLTSTQTVNSATITRAYNGALVAPMGFLEFYSPTGATPTTATIAYTNQAGAGASTTVAILASPVAGQMVQFFPASGDTGFESVQSVTLSPSTGTAGNFGITLAQPILQIGGATANAAPAPEDFGNVGLPQIAAGACLFGYVVPSTTSTGFIQAFLNLIQA